MDVKYFIKKLYELGVEFYTGVPDSHLKPFCDILYKEFELGKDHIVAANEGAAVGLAAGHYLASGQPAVVYMQNSGIGNAVNPIASLLHSRVYRIPTVFVVGWRGKPGEYDEPQHVFQGEITVPLLELLGMKIFVIKKDMDMPTIDSYIAQAKFALECGTCPAFVVEKNGLTSDTKAVYTNKNGLAREEAIRIIVESADNKDIFVSTTGKASRELFEIREASQSGHEKDFLTVGSMGHASMIAMGIALEMKDTNVWCIDGDGASIMHLGSMAVLSGTGCDNLIHVILNNYAHETVGGMPVNYMKTDFQKIGIALGYNHAVSVDDEDSLKAVLKDIKDRRGTRLIEVKVSLGAREDLGRPTASPGENKSALMEYIRTCR